MADKMNIYIGATAMRTCLGNKAETLAAMHEGKSGLRYNETFGMFAGICDVLLIDAYTRFESLLIEQIDDVVKQSGLNVADDDIQLVISTTKGNVDLLAEDCDDIPCRAFIYESAKIISQYFNFKNEPIVVSNACISGVSAFVVARDLILSGRCRHVIVAGCDVLSEFITSGFASFKSVSPNPCRPYDADRDGLTLGEAAAAVMLTVKPTSSVILAGGAITNDANHISGPSRTGDGLFYAISNAMKEAGVTSDDIAFVNTHGTATRYNDEMESKAVAWAHLDDKPLNSLKGYIGHTLGASGVVETALSVEQLKRGTIFGTKGFITSDVPHHLKVSLQEQSVNKQCCVKTASGFGGCNAAIVLQSTVDDLQLTVEDLRRESRAVAEYIMPQSELPFAEFIRTEFKSFGESNMKFYKMSDMSKALYVAVERLLSIEGWGDVEPIRRAIILSNSAASLDTDAAHQHILNQHLPEGTSPAVFVYTLPNVSAGEMCIRHKIQGDNTFFIEDNDASFAECYAHRLIERNRADAVITGWCEYLKGKWNIHVKLLKHN